MKNTSTQSNKSTVIKSQDVEFMNQVKLDAINFNNQFGRGTKSIKKQLTNNCVIYTRVSSKSQESGYSLDTQLKDNIEFARKNNYNVLSYFGGTYESATTDERKEFNRMLSFCKKSKEKVSYIIVHMVDRFSRSGANSIYIKEQLKNNGIYIQSVRQPVDVTTSSGDFQQNIQMIFSHYDNQVRREKCMSGILEALNRGEWCHGLARGYTSIKENGKRRIIINEDGKLIRKAFYWKANESITNEEVRQRLAKLGLKLSFQAISNMFKNPFYCGLISHQLLEGKVVEGNHEKIVSKELFMKVNDILNKHSHGYKCQEEQIKVPMKVFLKCDKCGHSLSGYIVKKKQIWYYKCKTKGCCVNKSAAKMHDTFAELLKSFTLNDKYVPFIKEQMYKTISGLTKETNENIKHLKTNLKDLEDKLSRLEERYVIEEITQELYVKYGEKYKQDKYKVLVELQKLEADSSNHENIVEMALENAKNFNKMWHSGGYEQKRKVQDWVFPQGMRYNKENDTVRTDNFNMAFLWMACQQQTLSKIKSGIPILNLGYSALVGSTGFEPVTPCL